MKILLLNWLLLVSLQAFTQHKDHLVITLYFNDTLQKIRNIGASGCWFSEEIGKEWPLAKKQRIAEMLFSRDFDKNGQPKGIGLSAWRFNIGAGTAEQDNNSGIRDAARRVECFLSPDGKYDWNKQQGYRWLLQQAKNYGVEDLIAFVNSPPVHFTKNGLGFKLEKDSTSNLKENKYADYGEFLATVMKYFDSQNLHFNYISPVNEPQWDWTGKFGEAKQEGSAWTNAEIYHAVRSLDSSLTRHQLKTKILITEAGQLDHLYAFNAKASRQIANFWDTRSPLFIAGLSHTTPFVEGHGYFTDKGDERLISTRRSLRDTLETYGSGLEFWQSEYCMLGDGYKENTTGRRSAIDCALFLSKMIHTDLVIGNATAWHYWNSYEPGKADSDTRYYLIALNPKRVVDTSSLYTVTKNLWALGHYSFFVRPGMYRIRTGRNDGLTDLAAAQQVMISAFRDKSEKKLVVNLINYTTVEKEVELDLIGIPKHKVMQLLKHYITSVKEGDDLKPYPINNKSKSERNNKTVILPARSINTLVFSS